MAKIGSPQGTESSIKGLQLHLSQSSAYRVIAISPSQSEVIGVDGFNSSCHFPRAVENERISALDSESELALWALAQPQSDYLRGVCESSTSLESPHFSPHREKEPH